MKAKKTKGEKKGKIISVLKSIGKFLVIASLSCGLSFFIIVFLSSILVEAYQSRAFMATLVMYISWVILVGAVGCGFILYKLWQKGKAARITISILGTLVFSVVIYILFYYISLFFFPSHIKDFPTTPGIESTTLIPETSGSIASTMPTDTGSEIAITSLPDRNVRSFSVKDSIFSLAGPDKDGRVLYITGEFNSDRSKENEDPYQLIRYSTKDATRETIFSRKGDSYSGIQGSLALSPSGNRIAYVSNLERQYSQNEDSYSEGTLEVWDLATKRQISVALKATDGSISWASEETFFYTTYENGTRKIYLYDIAMQKKTYYTDGENPVVSPDGSKLIYAKEEDNTINLVNLTSNPKEQQQVTLPGFIVYWYSQNGVIGFAGSDKVVYWGYTTEGKKVELTQHNSPMVGPKQTVTLKIGDLKTGAFQTVVEGIDPRDAASFGY